MDNSSRQEAAPSTSPSRKRKKSVSPKPKSESIPITNHIHRTESEQNLCEDEAFAEYRDHCMYNRIVKGLSRRQEHAMNRQVRSLDFLYENGQCIANIKRTRHQHPDDCESLHARHERAWKTIKGDSSTEIHRPKARDIVTEANSFLDPTFPRLDDDDEDQMFPMDPWRFYCLARSPTLTSSYIKKRPALHTY